MRRVHTLFPESARCLGLLLRGRRCAGDGRELCPLLCRLDMARRADVRPVPRRLIRFRFSVPPPTCAEGERFVYQEGGCRPCRACPYGQYEIAPCELLGPDTACVECTRCTGMTWRACGLRQDTVCMAAECPEGQVVSDERPECVPCPPGTFAGIVCRRCEGGTIAPDWGSSACTACDGYGYAAANRTLCTVECEVGSVASVDGDCEPCPPGTAGEGCAPCPPDTFAAVSGLAECVPCVPPLYALAGSSVCSEPICFR